MEVHLAPEYNPLPRGLGGVTRPSQVLYYQSLARKGGYRRIHQEKSRRKPIRVGEPLPELRVKTL